MSEEEDDLVSEEEDDLVSEEAEEEGIDGTVAVEEFDTSSSMSDSVASGSVTSLILRLLMVCVYKP